MQTPQFDNDAAGRFFRLLDAIASEVSTLGDEMLRVGDRLTEAMAAGDQNYQIRELQHFDVIGQGVLAHAGILKALVQYVDTPHVLTNADLDALIGAIPFHAIRERLAAALENREADFSMHGTETSEFF